MIIKYQTKGGGTFLKFLYKVMAQFWSINHDIATTLYLMDFYTLFDAEKTDYLFNLYSVDEKGV